MSKIVVLGPFSAVLRKGTMRIGEHLLRCIKVGDLWSMTLTSSL